MIFYTSFVSIPINSTVRKGLNAFQREGFELWIIRVSRTDSVLFLEKNKKKKKNDGI